MGIFLLLATVGFVTVTAFGQGDSANLSGVRAYLKIDERLSTSGQIKLEEIGAIKDAGFDVVVNLAPADEDRNQLEGYHVVKQGMTYVHIPVSWENPRLEDLRMFFDVMDANRSRKVYVHCFANMRVSVFVFLYRTLRQHVPEDEALADLRKIWNPDEQPQWATLMSEARREFSRE